MAFYAVWYVELAHVSKLFSLGAPLGLGSLDRLPDHVCWYTARRNCHLLVRAPCFYSGVHPDHLAVSSNISAALVQRNSREARRPTHVLGALSAKEVSKSVWWHV